MDVRFWASCRYRLVNRFAADAFDFGPLKSALKRPARELSTFTDSQAQDLLFG